MDKDTLDLYLYMGSYQKIIEEFENQGIKTEAEAINALRGNVKSNMMDVAKNIGMGNGGVTLAGTCNASKKVLAHFKNKEANGSE